MSIIFIKEPKRGVFDNANLSIDETEGEIENPTKKGPGPFKEFKDALAKVITNPVAKWTTIAGCFRFFETFSIVYFLPSFF